MVGAQEAKAVGYYGSMKPGAGVVSAGLACPLTRLGARGARDADPPIRLAGWFSSPGLWPWAPPASLLSRCSNGVSLSGSFSIPPCKCWPASVGPRPFCFGHAPPWLSAPCDSAVSHHLLPDPVRLSCCLLPLGICVRIPVQLQVTETPNNSDFKRTESQI